MLGHCEPLEQLQCPLLNILQVYVLDYAGKIFPNVVF